MAVQRNGQVGAFRLGNAEDRRCFRTHRGEELVVHRVDAVIVEIAAQKPDVVSGHRMLLFAFRPAAEGVIRPGSLAPKTKVVQIHALQRAGFQASDAVRVSRWDDQQPAPFPQRLECLLVSAEQVLARLHDLDEIGQPGEPFDFVPVHRSHEQDDGLVTGLLVEVGRGELAAHGGIEIGLVRDRFKASVSDAVERTLSR